MTTPKGGWRTEKVHRPRHEILPFITWLRGDLASWPDDRWMIGGSWRRKAPEIGDLDIMVVTESGTFEDFPFPPNFKREQGGPNKVMGSLFLDKPVMADGDAFSATERRRIELHADFWACTPRAQGAMALFITGPKALNIEMRRLAAAMGRILNEKGLFDRDGKQIDNGTEQSIFEHLYAYQPDKWLTPEQRQEYATYKPPDTARVRSWEIASDSGNGTYTVTCTGEGRHSSWKCKCKAFQYSREIPASCKHVKRKKEDLRREGEDVG